MGSGKDKYIKLFQAESWCPDYGRVLFSIFFYT